jgi:AraC family transcriptional regulator of adaptative response/methylated-DNA-[protein]-cysteine methyltransferase
MHAAEIVYGRLPSPLGEMLAGATEEGVCFLDWPDDGGMASIVDRVTKRYRSPLRRGDHAMLQRLRQELAAYLAGELKMFTVPLDTMGTEFEQRVWRQLCRIPYGQTKTYGEIARALGRPGASRAVGRANGANCVPIIIPCHRVIAAGGKLGGYGGGLHRKKYLLHLEAGVDTPVGLISD